MKTILDGVRAYLPLRIDAVDTDPDGISIGGNHWRLRINTNWRVVLEGRIIGSSGLSGQNLAAPSRVEDLIGDNIVEADFQSSQITLDLSLSMVSGRILEIFSDFPYGEWIFSIWNRDDPQQVPIFDLEGPVSELS